MSKKKIPCINKPILHSYINKTSAGAGCPIYRTRGLKGLNFPPSSEFLEFLTFLSVTSRTLWEIELNNSWNYRKSVSKESGKGFSACYFIIVAHLNENCIKVNRHVLKKSKTRRYTAIKRQSPEIVKYCKHSIKYTKSWRKVTIKNNAIWECYCHRTSQVNMMKPG